MKTTKKKDLFWPSYADLMTSLFFVMLALYALTFILLKKEKDKVLLDAKRYQEIKKVEEGVRKLEDTKNFEYDSLYKRLILTEQIKFDLNKHNIKEEYKPYLKNVGEQINGLISNRKDDVRYLIIVEGMASKDFKKGLTVEEEEKLKTHNYLLSYRRAHALYKLWVEEERIDFSPENTEFIIAGSGTGGVGRNIYNEKANQRFLIQVIPKISAKAVDVNSSLNQ